VFNFLKKKKLEKLSELKRREDEIKNLKILGSWADYKPHEIKLVVDYLKGK